MLRLSMQWAGSYVFHRDVAPAPFLVVRIRPVGDSGSVGAGGRILYIPSPGIWRVTIDGTPVWLDVPWGDERRLRAAARHVRPYAAPADWSSATAR